MSLINATRPANLPSPRTQTFMAGAFDEVITMMPFRNAATLFCMLLILVVSPFSSCHKSAHSSPAVTDYVRLLATFPRSLEQIRSAGAECLIAVLLTPYDPLESAVIDELIARHDDPELLEMLLPLRDDTYLRDQMELMDEAMLLRNPWLREPGACDPIPSQFPRKRIIFHGLLFICSGYERQEFAFLYHELVNDETYSRLAADFLGYMDCSTASQYVDQLVAAKNEDQDLVNTIDGILAQFPSVDVARESVLDDVDSEDIVIRWFAVTCLGTMVRADQSFMCADEIIGPLLTAMDDARGEVRVAACVALGYHGQCESAETALWNAYRNDPNCLVRFTALQSLASVAPPRETVPLLVAWLDGPECCYGDQLTIINILGEIGPAAIDAVPRLERYLYPGPRPLDEGRWSWPGLWSCDAFRAITAILAHEPEVPEGWRLEHGC